MNPRSRLAQATFEETSGGVFFSFEDTIFETLAKFNRMRCETATASFQRAQFASLLLDGSKFLNANFRSARIEGDAFGLNDFHVEHNLDFGLFAIHGVVGSWRVGAWVGVEVFR